LILNLFIVVDVVFKCLRQRSNGLKLYLPAVFYMYVKYENLFTQEYPLPWGQHLRGIWYSWVNKFSYFLNLYAINVLLYRMGRNVGLRAIFLIDQIVFSWILILNLFIVVDVVFKCLRQRSNGLKLYLPEGVEYDFYFMEYDFYHVWSCVLILTHCPI
jgi:hypothetical protein